MVAAGLQSAFRIFARRAIVDRTIARVDGATRVASQGGHMATTLYVGGLVRPCDGTIASAEALVERDGRVVAVGGRHDMEGVAGAGAAPVDVRGATILPGLVDTHPHVLHFGVFSYPLIDL